MDKYDVRYCRIKEIHSHAYLISCSFNLASNLVHIEVFKKLRNVFIFQFNIIYFEPLRKSRIIYIILITVITHYLIDFVYACRLNLSKWMW